MRFLLCAALLIASQVQAQTSPIPDGATLERIAEGFQFTEGPLWVNGALLFSDIPANTVYRWAPGEATTVFRSPSQKSNGLALDADGRLLIAQHAARRIARLSDDGRETALAAAYDGKALNSPNDIAVHPDKSLYFTDPTWGLEGRASVLGFTGVYRLDPIGAVHLLVDSLHQPNGIVFSPDLETLYVSTSDERTIVAYDLEAHTLSNGRRFVRMTGGASNDAADGMEVDADGNLYVTGPRGVWVLDPEGTVLDIVDVPGQTTNVAWGDADGQTLYITSGPAVYSLRVGASTASEPDASDRQLEFVSVSPNPASHSATLTYRILALQSVELVLVDTAGRDVRRLDRGVRARGEHIVEVDFRGLSAGVYIVRLRTQEAVISRPLTIPE